MTAAAPNRTQLRPWWQARLSRRLALWIFLNFLVVETVVLVPSVLRQTQRLEQQLRAVTNAKVQWLIASRTSSAAEALLQSVRQLQGPSMLASLTGATIYDAGSGRRLGRFGAAPELLPEQLPAGVEGRWFPLQQAYDGIWRSQELKSRNLVLVIRHSDSDLRRGLRSYIGNIVLIVLGIAGFLTLITMLVMQRLVIQRVLLLRDHLLRSGEAFSQGMPAEPQSFLIPSQAAGAADELSEVIQAFNGSFQRTSHEMEQRIAAEAAARAEHERAESLLLNILPAPIAAEMKQGRRTIATTHRDVTVLFADIVGFTKLSRSLDGEALVALLNRVFSSFDALSERHGLEKIKTIGDSYMAVGGLPTAMPDNAAAVAAMALEMQAMIGTIAKPLGQSLSLRIGIHSGPVVAGVIGRHKFSYDLWGDTVNLASRMESNGEPGRIQLSGATACQLAGSYAIRPRGTVMIKGVGAMSTYWLEGPLASSASQ